MLSYTLMKGKLVAGCQCAMGAQPRFSSVLYGLGAQAVSGCVALPVVWCFLELVHRPGLHIPQHRRGGCSPRFIRE